MRVESEPKRFPTILSRRDIVVVIDALRCSSTIVTALENGAKSIIPAKTLREALEIRKLNPRFLLAGERRGIRPRGFDFGNSPIELSRSKVAGRTIILTTTAGTKAILSAKDSKWVLIGSFLNAKAVARKATEVAEDEKGGISIVTAGKSGELSLEDFLCAGAIVDSLPDSNVVRNDSAILAALTWRHAENALKRTVREGTHGRYLVNIGYERDVELCCSVDRFESVPYLKGDRLVRA